MLALGDTTRSTPASTSALSCAIGEPETVKSMSVLRKRKAAVGVRLSKACCQATDARGMIVWPLAIDMVVAARMPRLE